ncbi:M48 family metallopeptidase [Desulfatitalea alkaliphila]|uniref:M48 family metallopeptidase n=1 Tax=Desulfatitalea alkaliphila TaxID=2929485 RepID=A0AA41R7G9_9BACT|nr:M48 family metallopeptidase [Desulfatitalea alkaliphila]MCJ8502625.1 M48 family metallopeptidase [Desulfatitalea alkaliphila]
MQPVRRQNRFNRTRLVIIAVALALTAWACAQVPVTGRSSLQLVSNNQLAGMAVQQYNDTLEKSTLSKDAAQTAMVRRVGTRIADAAEQFLRETGRDDLAGSFQWEFNLIEDDETVNAWVLPGGKTVVYTGILKHTQNETGLAVVLGHEVAHALAGHGNERVSQGLLTQLGGVALAVALAQKPAETQQLFMAAYGLGANVGVLLPYSRLHEREADRIGLVLMAMAGYDPRESVPFWQRMNSEGGARPPEFLSTHPAPDTRIAEIERYLPEALSYYKPTR